MLLLKFVLKTNYLHIRNELKAYVYYLCFLKYWQISIFLSYQISSPSMQAHLRSHIGRGACLWEGWWNGKRFIKYLVTSLITRTSPMDIGYHVTYDNLVAKYCTIPLTVFRYLIWVWHGKIIIKIDFYQQKKNHNYFMVDCISCTIHVSGLHSSRKKHASMTGLIWF